MATTISTGLGSVYGSSTFGRAIFGIGSSLSDLTPYIVRDSLTVKLNTLDFTLNNPPVGSVLLGATVKLTDPAWSGTIASIMTANPVNWRNGIQFVSVTATNANALLPDTAPFDLSDVPSVTPPFDYLLEDGSGHYLLEDGTDFAPGVLMLEGALSYGYSGLSVRTSVNSTAGGPPQTQGRAHLTQPGLRPGNIFALTSLNQNYSAAPFEVTQVTIVWPGPVTPHYDIEFGDTSQTLSAWAAAHAVPDPAPLVTPPVITPPTTQIWGTASSITGLQTTGGGIVTVASNTFTINPAPGKTLTCQVVGAIDARMDQWDNYVPAPRRAVRASLSGGIYTGAWQELPFSLTRATYDLSSASGLALAAGTYTVKIEIDTQEFNQMRIYSGWVQVAVTST